MYNSKTNIPDINIPETNIPETTKIIDEIIRKRKTTAEAAKREEERLKELLEKITILESKRQQLIQLPDNFQQQESLKEIDFPELVLLIAQEQKTWEKLWKRFSRNTINIGVVGLARQGKSTLLQTLSALTSDEIPSSDRMPCTSVQSNIYHINENRTYAKVYFYSETSFLQEVIAPYYQHLGFGLAPLSLAEFNRPLPSLVLNNSPNPAQAESLYNHLKNDYHVNINKYANLLQSEERVLEITKEDISKYVSQKYDPQGNPLFFSHLAVRKVEIFCRFPKVGVEKVGLVDMPGLGDTRLGDVERMIKALGEDVDFILFIRRPSGGGDLWRKEDITLYDTASSALKEKLPLNEWSFMVINRDRNNVQQCQDLGNTRDSKGIHVVKSVIGDCTDSEQANSILEEVLQYLTNNLERLDRQYMASCGKSLKLLGTKTNAELEKAAKALEQYGEEYSEYVKLRDPFIKDLYNEIEKLRQKYRDLVAQPDPHFKAQVEEAIKNCQNSPGIPSEEELKSKSSFDGIDAAYFWGIQQMRQKLLKNFHSIDKGLKESLEVKKAEAAEVLLKLGLENLTEERGIAFIERMAELIPANLTNLKLGFEFLSTFDILYKGIIQSIVWEHLSKFLPSNPYSPLSTSENVKKIQEHLKQLHQEAVASCQKSLNILTFAPTEVGCSMIEEFADHITRAEGVRQEWDIFLGTKPAQIWPQLKKIENRKLVQQEWINLVKEARDLNYN